MYRRFSKGRDPFLHDKSSRLGWYFSACRISVDFVLLYADNAPESRKRGGPIRSGLPLSVSIMDFVLADSALRVLKFRSRFAG